jgi:AcrR family transcriptional regulator
MPRAFTDSERAAIHERLVAAGQDLFGRRGIRATTVEQLARAAGISKGAFYFFFPSKEALFFAIVEEVETAMQARLAQQVAETPQDAVRILVRAALNARLENPLFDVAISEEAVSVLRTMTADEQEAFLRRDVDMTASIAGLLAASGFQLSASPELLAGLLRAMVFVGMHREDIGAEAAPAVEDFLVETLSAALSETAPSGSGRSAKPRPDGHR